MRIQLLPLILTCIAIGSSLGLVLILLFDTGNFRELGIFLASFGLPTIPIACVYGALGLANQVVERKRRKSDFTEIQEQLTFGAFGLGGLLLGILGAAGCLYILYVSLMLRAGN